MKKNFTPTQPLRLFLCLYNKGLFVLQKQKQPTMQKIFCKNLNTEDYENTYSAKQVKTALKNTGRYINVCFSPLSALYRIISTKKKDMKKELDKVKTLTDNVRFINYSLDREVIASVQKFLSK